MGSTPLIRFAVAWAAAVLLCAAANKPAGAFAFRPPSAGGGAPHSYSASRRRPIPPASAAAAAAGADAFFVARRGCVGDLLSRRRSASGSGLGLHVARCGRLAAARPDGGADEDGDTEQPGSRRRSGPRLVWLTGHGDLRLHDHGGFSAAVQAATASSALATSSSDNEEKKSIDVIVPVFVLDPEVHLRSRPESFVRRLHACLSGLEADIAALSDAYPTSVHPLVVRTGPFAKVVPDLAIGEVDAAAIHVIGDDVVPRMRDAQRAAVRGLAADVEVVRWTNCIRPEAPWAKMRDNQSLLPSFFPDYCRIADPLPTAAPREVEWNVLANKDELDERSSKKKTLAIPSDGVPSLDAMLNLALSATPTAVTEALSSRPEYCITTEPYEDVVTANWCTERGARAGLEEYCRVGRDAFAKKYFGPSNVVGKDKESCPKGRSMYNQAAARILKQTGDDPGKVLALRETATRAFSSALKLGALSPADVADAAKNRSPNTQAKLFPSDDPLWGRSSEGSLHDVVEWREWFLLLAERSLALQERGEPATYSGGEKIQRGEGEHENGGGGGGGDPREVGRVNYWRWKGQHLVRYITWPAGEDYDKQAEDSRAPAILLVHGFAASAEQWGRLVHSLRAQAIKEGGKDVTPPIYAVDLLGFGHSEKPGLSYTQYLWESQLIDFAIEVMEARPMIMAGNSIGGGISAGAAASLGKMVRGLVLCNTAGVLEDPDTYTGYEAKDAEAKGSIRTHTEAALEGNPGEAPYSAVPLFGNKALDVFGAGIIKLIYPQIEDRLSVIYGNRMENADPAVVYAIQQGAASPGSANVIGSGQKLAPNRPLNEVLVGDGEGDGFPVLVVMGLDDRVSSPQAAKTRAELFSRLSPGKVLVEEIEDAGHCPHDDQPEKVADAMLRWLPNCFSASIASSTDDVSTMTTPS